MPLPTPPADAPPTAPEVAVGFTSPALIGARLRRDSDGRLRIATPDGGDAAADWTALADSRRITLHDRLLLTELAALPVLSPRMAAAAANRVASGGAAGRAARRTAVIARQQQEEEDAIAQFLLVIRLLEETGVDGVDWRRLNPSDPTFHDWLLASAERLAPTLGGDGRGLADWLERLAARVAPVGLPGEEYAPRIPRLLENLAALRDSLRGFAGGAATEADGALARRLADLAATAHDRATAACNACHRDFQSLQQLYVQWPQLAADVVARCEAPDWLLDGWPVLCLTWSEALVNGRPAQTAALAEMARLAWPWLADAPATDVPDDDHDPAIVDRIYRHELLKASAP